MFACGSDTQVSPCPIARWALTNRSYSGGVLQCACGSDCRCLLAQIADRRYCGPKLTSRWSWKTLLKPVETLEDPADPWWTLVKLVTALEDPVGPLWALVKLVKTLLVPGGPW